MRSCNGARRRPRVALPPESGMILDQAQAVVDTPCVPGVGAMGRDSQDEGDAMPIGGADNGRKHETSRHGNESARVKSRCGRVKIRQHGRAEPMRRTDRSGRQRSVVWTINFGSSSAGWRAAGKSQRGCRPTPRRAESAPSAREPGKRCRRSWSAMPQVSSASAFDRSAGRIGSVRRRGWGYWGRTGPSRHNRGACPQPES